MNYFVHLIKILWENGGFMLLKNGSSAIFDSIETLDFSKLGNAKLGNAKLGNTKLGNAKLGNAKLGKSNTENGLSEL